MRKSTNKPAHVVEKLHLPELPDEYWWKIKDNAFVDVPEMHLMKKGWIFSSSVDYSLPISLVHTYGHSISEGLEICARNLWDTHLKKQAHQTDYRELWAR